MKKSFNYLSMSMLVGIALIAYLFISTQLVSYKQITEPRESGAKKALNFINRMRAYPNNDVPKAKFMEQFDKNKKSLRKTAASIEETLPWKAMGPLNVPGRMISVAVNPQNSKTLYAGSATGGLWRTFNSSNGANWHRITTGFPTLGVMAIAIDPTDSLNMLIGTGETYGYSQSIGGYVWRTSRGSYGIGILKTTDGGVTWEKSLDWTFDQRRGIQDLALNPLNSNTVFAATSEGIYRSYNQGANWQKVYSVEMAEDIVMHTLDSNKILVSTGNLGSPDAGIYRTIDGGDNWNKVNGIPTYTGKTLMDIYQSNPDIVFADVADSLVGIGLFKTTDFGDSWTKIHSQDIPQYQGFFAHWVAVHPSNQNKIVQAGVQITQSQNGGISLTIVSGPHVDHHNYGHDPNNDDILYIACDGGIYRTTNFGVSYTNIGYGLQTSQFYNGFTSSFSDSNFALGGLQDNNTVIFRGDNDWSRVIGGDGSWSAVNSLNDNIVYGSWQYGNILRSNNRGSSFANSINGIGGNAAFIAPYVISHSNPSILYAGRRQVFKTENGGDNWSAVSQVLDGNEILSMSVSSQNPDVVFVGTAPVAARAHVYATYNGGETWTDVTSSLPDRYYMDIAIDPNNENTAYLVLGGYGSGHVYKTSNGGTNWYDITGTLPDVPTLAITVDPFNSKYIYVGSDLGVFVSEDGGVIWNDFNDGLPEAVMGMDLNISNANRSLWVATHGNGAYRRPLVFIPDFYLTVNVVGVPSSALVGQELNFEASVRNAGNQAQSEDYSIEARLLDPSGNQVYSEVQTFCCLEPGETTNIEFTESYTVELSGNYNFELIQFGNSQLPGNDTLRQTINIVEPASILLSDVTKITREYTAIVSGLSLNGDDVQKIVDLPFSILYDDYQYNEIQLSTNGWVEFGIGTVGSERGLSSANQIGSIGANENGRMAGTARPTKALGPWWEDLNADGNGKVRYVTQGTQPNRVFVIQWEDIRAYWDAAATTTRLNFQVRLYEGSNLIEYCYGDVVAGTFGGGDIGASIGFKDHVGGDYRFYDIITDAPIPAGEVNTSLSPLKDWPGKNTVYQIATTTTSIDEQNEFQPESYLLYQNYPNPFNPSTTIKYQLAESGFVTLKVYDITGSVVQTLVNKSQKPGTYQINFEASHLSSGVYFYTMVSKGFIQSRKMILLK